MSLTLTAATENSATTISPERRARSARSAGAELHRRGPHSFEARAGSDGVVARQERRTLPPSWWFERELASKTQLRVDIGRTPLMINRGGVQQVLHGPKPA
jgi:hypothetical protein